MKKKPSKEQEGEVEGIQQGRENKEEIDVDNNDGAIPPEILEAMPPEVRSHIKESFGIISGPVANPIARKLTPEHITKVLDQHEAESQRLDSYRKQGRWFNIAILLIALGAFFLFAVMFGYSNPELFKQSIAFLATFFAGFAGGWGINAAISKRE